jgi:integrase
MSEKRITVWVQKFPDRRNLVLRWTDPINNRRIKSKSTGTADPKEAEAARIDLEADLNNGRYQDAARISWERFRELFEEEYLPNCRPTTRRQFQNTFRLLEEVCNPRTLRSINERVLSAFVAGLRRLPGRISKQGRAPSGIRVCLAYMHAALNWAVQQKILPAVPAAPTVTVPKKRPQPVPVESFERLLVQADQQMRAYLLCGWLAGLRRNEALLLERQQTDRAPWLDLGRNRIWLPAEFVKAGEDQWVPLDPDLREALEALPRRGRHVFHFVMPGGEPATPSGMSKLITELARKAGVRLNMRSLRRGFGCRYAGKVPAQVLQRLMRHAKIDTTMDFYANVDEAVEAAVLGDLQTRLQIRPGSMDADSEAGDSAKPIWDKDLGETP